jgi:sugar transferase (PEP-CTERM system associated)
VISENVIIAFSLLASLKINNVLYLQNSELSYINIIVIQLSTILVFYIADLYNHMDISQKKEILYKALICCIISFFIISGINSILYNNVIQEKIFLIYFSISTTWIILFRLAYFKITKIKELRKRVLIIGYSEIVKNIYEEINKFNDTYDFLGVVSDRYIRDDEINDNIPIISEMNSIDNSIQIYKPDILVIALSERRGNFPSQIILESKLKGIIIEDATSFYEKITGKILVENLRPSWIIFADGFHKNNVNRAIKRVIDIVLAVIGVCGSFPLVILTSILVKLDSCGPVFFKQERVGENGRHFTLVKFRTMVADAEKDTGPVWSQTTDPRVTKLGLVLRRTGMDEIPQLFNVLRGDMSFVGPRPERPHFVTELQQKIPYYTQRLTVKPGITGWAQVRYGYGATLEDAVEKLQYDLYYIKNMSVFLDLLVILSTVHKVIFAKVAMETVSQQHGSSTSEHSSRASEASDQSYAVVVSDALEKRAGETKFCG